MSAFDIASAGLKAQQSAIEVTSNNVANSSTVGYKASEYNFVDQYFKAVQSASSSGVGTFGAQTVNSQGAIVAASSPLDLAIQGDGMFRLSSLPGVGAGDKYYSRNGQFSVDKEGYVVNANGLYLTGYQANTALTAVTSTIGAMQLPPAVLTPVASTEATLKANLDMRSAAPMQVTNGVITSTPNVFNANDPKTYNSSTTVSVYDSNGLSHVVNLFFKKIATVSASDPRSTTTPQATATAAQYEVYMQADGAQLTRTVGSNVGIATLGDEATAAQAVAQELLDQAINTAATAASVSSDYSSAILQLSLDRTSLGTQVTSLAAVSLTNSAGDAISTTTSTVVTNAVAVEAAKAAVVTATAARLAADSAVTASLATFATTALAAASDTYIALQAVQTTAIETLATAKTTLTTAQTTLDDSIAAGLVGTDSDDTTANAALVAYSAMKDAVDADVTALATALTAKTTADAVALAALTANSVAVAKTKIGTLQFIDGQLSGSLTKAMDGGPLVPAVYTVKLSDSQGSALCDVAIDLSAMTAFGSAFLVTNSAANGYAAGNLTTISVDEAGVMTGQYTNGKTMTAGQLVLAQFNSQVNLGLASQNVFSETFASGAPVLGTATAGSFGSVKASSLENSNIDMASELVALMVQQRNYQANSQSIKAADTLLTTAIQMGR
jgi:flagellar hook protein FlgE